MAISDYLMTRLGLAQQARSLAAQTEQARAQREAAQNRQNMAYLDALLQTGMKVPGVIGDIGAAQGAAGIQEATTGLEAGELAGPSEFTRSADLATKPAGMSAASTLTGAQTEVPPDQLLETPPGTATNIKSIQAGGPEDRSLPLPEGTYQRPDMQLDGETKLSTSPGFEELLQKYETGKAAAEKSEAEQFAPEIERSPERFQSKKQQEDLIARERELLQELAPEALANLDRASGRIPEQATGRIPAEQILTTEAPGAPLLPTEDELQGAFAGVSTAQPYMLPRGVEPREEIASRLMPSGIPGLPIPVQEVARTVPAEEPAVDVLPSVKEQVSPEVRQQIKELAAQQDPFEKAQSEFIKKLNSYQPPKYKVPATDAADKIVEDTWKNKQPNAILNFLSFGQYNNNLENAKRIAKKMVASEINGLRKQEGEAMRKQFIETAKLEAQQLAILQKKINADSKAELKVKLKSLNPEKALATLQDYKEVDRAINIFEDTTRNMIASGAKFPGGAKYNKVLADLKAFTAKPDRAKGATLNASLVAAGAGGGVNLGAETVNIDALQEAVQSLQNADMDDASKDFLTQQMLLAQTIGKAKEGGRMTDADLRFYLDNLFVSNANNPSTLLKSINRLKKVNANSQNDWLNIYQTLYPEIGLPFSALAGEGFTDEDLEAADKLGFYDVLQGAGTALGRARGQESMGSVVGGGISAIRSALPQTPSTIGAQPPPPRRRAARPANPLD